MTYRMCFHALFQHKKYLCLQTVSVALIFFLVTWLLLPTRYEATSLFCIRNQTATGQGVTASDLEASETLTEAVIALMEGMHDGESVFASRRMGAGVFRIVLTGNDRESLSSFMQVLSARAQESIPSLLQFASLTEIATQTSKEIPKNYILNTAAGAAIGFFTASALIFVLADRDLKKRNQTHKEEC